MNLELKYEAMNIFISKEHQVNRYSDKDTGCKERVVPKRCQTFGDKGVKMFSLSPREDINGLAWWWHSQIYAFDRNSAGSKENVAYKMVAKMRAKGHWSRGLSQWFLTISRWKSITFFFHIPNWWYLYLSLMEITLSCMCLYVSKDLLQRRRGSFVFHNSGLGTDRVWCIWNWIRAITMIEQMENESKGRTKSLVSPQIEACWRDKGKGEVGRIVGRLGP